MSKIQIGKSLVGTSAANVGVLALNFGMGVCIARTLGPAGRGEVASIVAWLQTLGWAAGLGLVQAYTYLVAKRELPGGDVLVTMLGATVVISGCAWLIAMACLKHVFAGQSAESASLAAKASICIPLIMANENVMAMTAGIGEFRTYSLSRLTQLFLTVGLLLAIHFLFGLSVGGVLLCQYGAGLLTLSLCGRRLVRVLGWGKFRPDIFKIALGYGLRQHGSNLGAMVSKGLDIMMMPIVGVAAVQIGIYSVAGNITYAVLTVMGSVSTVLFPAATGASPQQSAVLIGKGVRAVLGIGAVVVLFSTLFAASVIRVFYGSAFVSASIPLIVLMPGMILFAAAAVLSSGLQASNLPQLATVGQVSGFVVTAIGLAIFLKTDGIMGAAWVSLVAYTVTFLVLLALLASKTSFVISRELGPGAFVHDLRRFKSAVSRRLGRMMLRGSQG